MLKKHTSNSPTGSVQVKSSMSGMPCVPQIRIFKTRSDLMTLQALPYVFRHIDGISSGAILLHLTSFIPCDRPATVREHTGGHIWLTQELFTALHLKIFLISDCKQHGWDPSGRIEYPVQEMQGSPYCVKPNICKLYI